ncbi:hypothetical protein [Aliiruegeria lutimaris]|uniref:Invasion protein IalB, involved in pathogenesis n=1 Tax=Aliiruegeria lutimaris TaxID=571298 RepID=A0A1G8KQY7_9RHOB|nr:hypothetical protein [Aliiruegeria lutimaris]SDI45834.1 hypothetical protein SAMN04488026_100361 [Aliiruegeria lutimaris]
MIDYRKTALAVVACVAASGAIAQPFMGKGEVEGWNIFYNEATKGCFMETQQEPYVVQIGTEMAMLGEGDTEKFGFLAVYTSGDVEIADGEQREVKFDIDGAMFSGMATGAAREGFAGGYVVANNPNFGNDLAMKQTLTINPGMENAVEIDLTGTKMAMEATRECQKEMMVQ